MKNLKLCLTTLAFAFAGTQTQAQNASSPFSETISKEEMIANYHKSQGWQEQQKKEAVDTCRVRATPIMKHTIARRR